MSDRTDRIRVSENDKELLDDVKREMFGTTTPSYGETVAQLCEEYLEENE